MTMGIAAPDARRVIVDRNVSASMRDGTVLKADVYRPEASGELPVLLTRTPYGKAREHYEAIGRGMAERGYIVVVQDVRGRYESEGRFLPGFFSAEHMDAADGHDTVEWAAALPGSTGDVGTMGNSYDGWTQWELAHTRPPSLKAMLASGIAANLLDRELSGVLRLGRVLWWTINTLSPDQRRRAGIEDGPTTTGEADRLWLERDRSKWLWHLPISEIPESAMFRMASHFRRWLSDHASDHFGFLGKHREVEVPVLHTTGWYDQQIGTIKQFTGMVENGRTDRARSNQRLIVGPWTHTNTDLVRRVGEVDFGVEAERDFYDLADRWFGTWLKNERNEVSEWPPVQLFVMGANRWRDEQEWPLARTRYAAYFLHSGGHANTPSGDGTLEQEPPTNEPPDKYVYDPRDPVMTLYTPEGQHAPYDQRALDDRRDVLVYQTPPLSEPMEVTGPIIVKLHAASSAQDTDFVVKLMDVWPSQFVQELCHGIVRARYRQSYERPSLLRPGEVYEYTIEMNPTSNLFQPGHRIRLDVTSSDFPNFDRNHNTGGDDYFEATLKTARQTLFHDGRYPSRVILPVIR